MTTNTVDCACGKTVKAHLYEKHLTSKQHIYLIKPKK